MNLLAFTLLFLSLILEATVFSFPLTLFAVSTLSLIMAEKIIFPAFASGLILDLFLGRMLGTDSLFFLFIVWLADSLQKKILVVNQIYFVLFIISVTIFYSLIFYRYIDPWLIFSAVFAAFCFNWIWRRIGIGTNEENKKLSI